jgi:hypothetical protein
MVNIRYQRQQLSLQNININAMTAVLRVAVVSGKIYSLMNLVQSNRAA